MVRTAGSGTTVEGSSPAFRSRRSFGLRLLVGALRQHGGIVLSHDYVEVTLRASQVRFGDRLIGDEGRKLVIQINTHGGGVKMSHPAGQTLLTGDPLVRVLRRKPRVEIDDELPATIWRPLGPRRTQPWEGDT